MEVAQTKAQQLVLTLQEDVHKLVQQPPPSGDTAGTTELQNLIATNLAHLQRQIKNLDVLVNREINQSKRMKAKEKLSGLNQEFSSLSGAYNKFRSERSENAIKRAREELLQRNRPNMLEQETTTINIDRALLERESLSQSHTQIDQFLSMGGTILSNLRDQQSMLKGTQRRILDVANTLGMSQHVLRLIERRNAQDWAILIGGIVVTCVIMIVVVYYFG